MACYHPITAWQTDDGSVVFAERGRILRQLTLACGQCAGCRLEKSRQWAIRCIHEAKQHKHNCFITLTYNNEHLPEDQQLVKQHATRFMKRLREHAARENRLGKGGAATVLTQSRPTKQNAVTPAAGRPNIRFYMAGEYGGKTGRPHYHYCLFNCDFADKKYLSTTKAGSKIYTSATLEKLWTYGMSSIGEMTFESAAYTARYIMEKQTGKNKTTEVINTSTGEISKKIDQYNQMSRRPGIGLQAFERWHKDWYPEGQLTVRGHKSNTPRYYDKLHKKLDPLLHEELELHRYREGTKHVQDQTKERLNVREQVLKAKISSLKRHTD